MRVALAVSEPDWHAKALVEAFAGAGAEAVPLRLADCPFDTAARSGLRFPGFGTSLPDALMVRAVGAGSFEEVTRRLGVLHALGALGVPVWNSAQAIERCVDKSMTSFLLARAGIPTPESFAVEGIEAASRLLAEQGGGGALVAKPLFGAQGRGLRLVRGPGDLPDPEAVSGVYYLQRFVPTPATHPFRDFRLLVCAGEVVAAMSRRADDWITNIRRGGTPEPLEPDRDLADLALRAAEAVGARYAGVDLIRDPDGRALVIEVNSMPGWRGLQSVTERAIAASVARALLGSP